MIKKEKSTPKIIKYMLNPTYSKKNSIKSKILNDNATIFIETMTYKTPQDNLTTINSKNYKSKTKNNSKEI